MSKSEKTEQGNDIVHPTETEVVVPPKPVAVPCVVGVNAQQTVPVGSYANVKVGVHLSVTVEPEDIDEAFDQVSEWVGDKLGEMIDAVEKAYGGGDGEEA